MFVNSPNSSSEIVIIPIKEWLKQKIRFKIGMNLKNNEWYWINPRETKAVVPIIPKNIMLLNDWEALKFLDIIEVVDVKKTAITDKNMKVKIIPAILKLVFPTIINLSCALLESVKNEEIKNPKKVNSKFNKDKRNKVNVLPK